MHFVYTIKGTENWWYVLNEEKTNGECWGWKGTKQSFFVDFFLHCFPYQFFKLNEAHGYLALKLHLKAKL